MIAPLLSVVLSIVTPSSDAISRTLLARAPAGVTRVELVSRRDRVPEGCSPRDAEVLGSVGGSGRVTLRLSGTTGAGTACTGWSWLEVKLFSHMLVTTRALSAGDALGDAVTLEERELAANGRSYPQELPAEAVSAERLAAGTPLEAREVRTPGQIPGRTIPVRLRVGDLVVDATGQSQACQPNLVCAVLPSGKRVAGRWIDGRLEVALP